MQQGIGGQDTKVILLKNGKVTDFIMNDKYSAGTGKFLEIMANRLGLNLEEMFRFAKDGKDINLSSTCTVFAESAVISLVNRKPPSEWYFLTGGFSNSPFVISEIEKKLKKKVFTHEVASYAGAIGACIIG